MAGLDPAIHIILRCLSFFLDGRIKCGHDNKRYRYNKRPPLQKRIDEAQAVDDKAVLHVFGV